MGAAWAGRPRGVALVGEAGIGKSRLVSELIGEAAGRGGGIVAGRAFETEQVLPFRPWIDALRSGRVTRDQELLEALTPLHRAALGHVFPEVGAASPSAGSYTAGQGTQVGLLSSPTAVAVMNPGTLIVLDAGASQLAAFDLNGNPVRQFGTRSPAAFTLNLLQPRTYLDVAVDGSGQIYVLSYQGNGSQPVQYRIDVFSPKGAPISTQSVGNNVPHFAVDYWRSIYAADFTALLDSSGQPYIDPALGVAAPSLSRFDPS